jgi:hypothetical protein
MLATYSDLKLELWLRQREADNILWETKNGDKLSIRKMDTSHLVNAINYLERLSAKIDEMEAEIDEQWEALSSIGDTEF